MKKLQWIIPLIIVIIGVSILVYKNFQTVTEVPNESWNREIKIATTPVQSELYVDRSSNGNYQISYFDENGFKSSTYDQDLALVEEVVHDIPYTKWTKVYIADDRVIYSDYYSMYLLEDHKKISDIQTFLPLNEGIVYQSDKRIYYMDPATLNKGLVTKGVGDSSEVDAFETKEAAYILVSETSQSQTAYQIYKWDGEQSTVVAEEKLQLPATLTLDELFFKVADGGYSLVGKAIPAEKNAPLPPESYYFSQQTFGAPGKFEEIHFKDPAGQGSLQGLRDIEWISSAENTQILFRANGYTETKLEETAEYNVYKGTIVNGQMAQIMRLSNTPYLSKQPSWVGEGIIAWMDVTGKMNNIYMASAEYVENFPESKLSRDSILRIAGKTFTMLAGSFFTFGITMIWYACPLVFLGVMMIGQYNAFDKEKEWVFYGPVFLYMVVAIIFDNHLFTSKVMERLPGYLSFPYSPFVLIVASAIITYLTMTISKMHARWTITTRITYFVGIHLLFLAVFVGPFLF